MTPVVPARPRWPRRSVLVLGLTALAVGGTPTRARAATIGVGDLLFDIPAEVSPAPAPATMGQGWQWTGQTPGTTALPSTSVLARADLASSDAGEILGMVLAGSASGLLPDLEVDVLRTRPMSGGGEQARVEIAYAAQPGQTYHGTLLIATRPAPPAAVLAVLGDSRLTAGMIDQILSTVRWRS